ncbi:acyl-CoA/acyl-ACP dehydrogenase (plasmid) [Tistrella bauzanensis]|uniref:acyl-CoA dehydrogenase family protein n=1 Tax=Tistrella TaxID=171436 RepID=UPI0031F62AB6
MNFRYTDEQSMLRDMARRWVDERYDLQRRKAAAATGLDRAAWAAMAEMGWLGVALPEMAGGSAGGAIETMIVMEEIGRGLMTEPYVSTAVIAAGLILDSAAAGDDPRLQAIAAGDLIAAFAHDEPGLRDPQAPRTTRATPGEAGTWRLDGTKTVVRAGAEADHLIVTATGPDGEALVFLADATTPGINRTGYPTLDGMRAAEIAFEGATLPAGALLLRGDAATTALARRLDAAITAELAEALGVMERLKDATLDYARTRHQFGQPIGKFQALQHRLADMHIACEEARSMVIMASVALIGAPSAGDEPQARGRAVSAARLHVAELAMQVGREAIQLHGGIGMTDELIIGHGFKRIKVIAAGFGGNDLHLDRFIALSDQSNAAA